MRFRTLANRERREVHEFVSMCRLSSSWACRTWLRMASQWVCCVITCLACALFDMVWFLPKASNRSVREWTGAIASVAPRRCVRLARVWRVMQASRGDTRAVRQAFERMQTRAYGESIPLGDGATEPAVCALVLQAWATL